jgi:hypothetical protein
MFLRLARRLSMAIATVGLSGLVLVPTAAATSGPYHVGPFYNSYSFVGFSCDGFDILIEGAGTDEYTIWRDSDGNLEKVLYRARYQHDTLTNTVTGRSIVVRGEFQETNVPIAGTDEFTKTITGFRYMVNESGAGVTISEVGRIRPSSCGRPASTSSSSTANLTGSSAQRLPGPPESVRPVSPRWPTCLKSPN